MTTGPAIAGQGTQAITVVRNARAAGRVGPGVMVREARADEFDAIGDLRVAAYRADGFLPATSGYAATLRALGADGERVGPRPTRRAAAARRGKGGQQGILCPQLQPAVGPESVHHEHAAAPVG